MSIRKLQKLSQSACIQHVTVGFIKTGLADATQTALSQIFGFEAKIFADHQGRVVYRFENQGTLDVQHLEAAMKKVRQITDVDFVDLWITDGDNIIVLECDDPSEVTVVFN